MLAETMTRTRQVPRASLMGVVPRAICLALIWMGPCCQAQVDGMGGIPEPNDPNNCALNEIRDPYENKCLELHCPAFMASISGVCTLPANSTTTAIRFSVRLSPQPFLDRPDVTDFTYQNLSALIRDWISNQMEFVGSLSQYCGSRYFLSFNLPSNGTIADDVLVKIYLKLEHIDVHAMYRIWHLIRRIVAIQAIGGIPTEVIHSDINFIGMDHIYTNQVYDALPQDACDVAVYDEVDILCPYVRLSIFEYKYALDDGIVSSLNAYYNYNKATSTLTKLVCIGHYLQWYLDGEKQTTSDLVFVIVSVVCTILSMICLIFTITTYTLFKDLRRPTPGKILLLLSVCLLVAQMFYLFGMDKTELGVGCKIIGVLTHYFWLAYMFSMSAYMVILVVSIGKPNQTLNAMSTKLHVTGIFSGPLLFIGLNIIISATVDGRFGYGKNLCYIDTALMRGVTFGVPIALVVIGNFCMYVFIIKRIMNTDASMLNIDRQYITVYMRLAILMGVTWVTGFVYEAWSNFVIGLIFIILNAGQGCLIMFSLVFRKAIYDRYKRLVSRVSDSDLATRTTVAL